MFLHPRNRGSRSGTVGKGIGTQSGSRGARAGLAAAAGVSKRAIMQQTGHKSTAMLRRYIRDGELFRENAAAAGCDPAAKCKRFVRIGRGEHGSPEERSSMEEEGRLSRYCISMSQTPE